VLISTLFSVNLEASISRRFYMAHQLVRFSGWYIQRRAYVHLGLLLVLLAVAVLTIAIPGGHILADGPVIGPH